MKSTITCNIIFCVFYFLPHLVISSSRDSCLHIDKDFCLTIDNLSSNSSITALYTWLHPLAAILILLIFLTAARIERRRRGNPVQIQIQLVDVVSSSYRFSLSAPSFSDWHLIGIHHHLHITTAPIIHKPWRNIILIKCVRTIRKIFCISFRPCKTK